MFLPASSSLPILPPPFTSILSPQYPSNNGNADHYPTNQSTQRRSNPRQPPPSSLRNPHSLYNLLLDESVISTRKTAVSTYGYSWLRPAGVAKTMLGRREEEAEREELERQMREQEEMELELERGEELARQARLREQQQQGQEGEGGEDAEQRNLDDEIPDADAEGETQHEDEADLDDEIPDADAGDTDVEDEDNVEGETGITDDVEHTNLEDGNQPPRAAATMAPSNRNLNARYLLSQAAQAAQLRNQAQEQAEQEALANAMLEEDEQAFADRDLDAEIPNEDDDGDGARDLDDDVPEADVEDHDDDGIEGEGEGEWQHTDTELEEDESGVMMEDGDVSMDMSAIGPRSTRTSTAAAGVTGMLATPESSMLRTPNMDSSANSGGRRWLNRRSLFGRGRTGNLFAGIAGSGTEGGNSSGSPQAPTLIQPQPQQEEEEQVARQQQAQVAGSSRRSARRRAGTARENWSGSARESLD